MGSVKNKPLQTRQGLVPRCRRHLLPLVLAGIGAWVLGGDRALFVIRLAIVWGALILAFIGGVRRGFGFGDPKASTRAEIVAAMLYFTLAGLALLAPLAAIAVALLMLGFVVAGILDHRAALRGDAPAHFARLRRPQLLLGELGLAACIAWLFW